MKLSKKLIEISLPLFLGIGILVWMYRDVNWADIYQTFLTMRWEWMLLSLGFGIIAPALRGLRWRLTLLPLNAKTRRSIAIDSIFISYASSLIIPRIGEVTRCVAVHKKEDIQLSKAIGTVVTERIVDMVTLLILFLFVFGLQWHTFLHFFNSTNTSTLHFLNQFTLQGYGVTLLCLVALLILVAILGIRFKIFLRLKGVIQNLWMGICSIKQVQRPWLYLFYSIAIWVCYFIHFQLTFYCFPFTESLGLIEGLVLFCIGTIAIIVPTPNGAGPWHFSIKTMLVLYGIGANPAISFVLVVHTLQTALLILLGGVGWLDLTLRRNYKTIQ